MRIEKRNTKQTDKSNRSGTTGDSWKGSPAASPRPALGVFDAIALVVGIVIGAGIYVTPGLVAGNTPNATWLIWSWVIGGAIALAGALCYAELATTYPHAGGDYHYLTRAFGRPLALLFGWARISVIPTGSIALLAFAFGDYASEVVSLGSYSSSIYAALIVALLTLINITSIKHGKGAQNLFTLVEVAALLLVIVAGLALVTPAAPPDQAAPASSHTPALGLAMVFVMLAYGGWNEASYISAEVRGKRHNLAIALILSIAIITALYTLVNLAFLRGLGFSEMTGSQTVGADLMRRAFGEVGASLIALTVAISALTSINATILFGARTSYAVGRDFAPLAFLGRWHSDANTPRLALLVQGAIALALVLLGTVTRQGVQTMIEFTAPVFWFFFLLAGISLFVLRRREPNLARPFRVPLYPFTPIVFCASSAYLLYSSIAYAGIGSLVGVAVLGAGALLMLFAQNGGRIPAERAPLTAQPRRARE
ncbi:MAG TPA: amino acid permease [Burkholderiales bacterium]|nr:amino acid permease [Burkholderiales bacterium]